MIKINFIRYLADKSWTRKFMWHGWAYLSETRHGVHKGQWVHFPADRWMIHYVGDDD